MDKKAETYPCNLGGSVGAARDQHSQKLGPAEIFGIMREFGSSTVLCRGGAFLEGPRRLAKKICEGVTGLVIWLIGVINMLPRSHGLCK